MERTWGGRANTIIFILPHCRGHRPSVQHLQKDLSSPSAAAFTPQGDKRLSVAAQVPPRGWQDLLHSPHGCPGRRCQARCVCTESGLGETMQSSLGGFQPKCPAAALEE